MSKKVLITGACGFVGGHILEYFLDKTDWNFVIIDKLSYAGRLSRIRNLSNYSEKRVRFVWHDLSAPINDFVKQEIGKIDFIIHMAANSSVEDTIKYPLRSVYDNVLATVNLLEYAKVVKPKLFNYFSTDEVYGPAPLNHNFDEQSWHRPSNPYSAGKAASEDYCYAYFITYGVPIFITNTMNVFGENQHPEKFIPTVIRKVASGETLPVYSNKAKTKAGSRFWIHGKAVADGLLFLLNGKAKPGERYHIVGTEKNNLDLAKKIAKIIGKPLKYKMYDFHTSRPGHDLRYGMNGEKMAKMGWCLPYTIDEYLEQTVKSYL
jgi:dTDP-glucose 4,6-dehydratase